jgi:hypothetical protein
MPLFLTVQRLKNPCCLVFFYNFLGCSVTALLRQSTKVSYPFPIFNLIRVVFLKLEKGDKKIGAKNAWSFLQLDRECHLLTADLIQKGLGCFQALLSVTKHFKNFATLTKRHQIFFLSF